MQQSTSDPTQFHSVDRSNNPASFVQFMHSSHAHATAQSYKQTISELLAVQPGSRLLDVGCGAGQDTLDLARAVGPAGHVIGIDNSQTMLEAARKQAVGLDLSLEYIEADATSLPFEDASFDACQVSRVLAHLREPERAIAEMVRVLRLGGRIVAADGDMDLLAIDLPERVLVRKVTHAICDQMVQGWMGRQMAGLFRQAGLQHIRIESRLMPLDYNFFQMAFRGILERAQASGSITSEELTHFWHLSELAESQGRFFARVGGFVVRGEKS